jgi:ECF sigma factor
LEPTLASLLEATEQGNQSAADTLFSALYSELHRIAKRELARRGVPVSLGATTLLHQAYLEMAAAGDLNARGATGGPENLAKQNFYVGINDSVGADPDGDTFSSHVFSDHDAWANLNGSPYRRSIARGEDLFNNMPIPITRGWRS